MRAASLSEPPLLESELEVRTVSDPKWVQADEDALMKPSLMRKLRLDGVGYQYWVMKSVHECYQLTTSDWLPLMHWYVCSAEWKLLYESATKKLSVPAHVFYALSSMIRYALISKSMHWPIVSTIDNTRYLVLDQVTHMEARKLESLYCPAIRIAYV